jgi:hypothetical protein
VPDPGDSDLIGSDGRQAGAVDRDAAGLGQVPGREAAVAHDFDDVAEPGKWGGEAVGEGVGPVPAAVGARCRVEIAPDPVGIEEIGHSAALLTYREDRSTIASAAHANPG